MQHAPGYHVSRKGITGVICHVGDGRARVGIDVFGRRSWHALFFHGRMEGTHSLRPSPSSTSASWRGGKSLTRRQLDPNS